MSEWNQGLELEDLNVEFDTVLCLNAEANKTLTMRVNPVGGTIEYIVQLDGADAVHFADLGCAVAEYNESVGPQTDDAETTVVDGTQAGRIYGIDLEFMCENCNAQASRNCQFCGTPLCDSFGCRVCPDCDGEQER